MIYYYILWGILLFLGLGEVWVKDTKINLEVKLFVSVGAFSLFLLFAGLKGNVGTDYSAYRDLYNFIPKYGPYDPVYAIEPLFWYWIKLIAFFSLPFVGFWFITTLLNLWMKFYVFNKLSPYLITSLIIYYVGLFFERDFDGIRQGIAIGICYLACITYFTSFRRLYLLLVLVAFFVHYTSIVFFLIPVIARIRISLKWINIFILLGVSIVVLKIDIVRVLMTVMPSSVLTEKLNTYLLLTDSGFVAQVGLSIGIIFRILILYLFLFWEKKIKIDKDVYLFLRNGFFISIVVSLFFNSVDIISHRLAYGLRELQIFIIPSFLTVFRSKIDKSIVFLCISFYSLILLNRILNTEHLRSSYYYKNYLIEVFNNE